jgi:hypothetical protein
MPIGLSCADKDGTFVSSFGYSELWSGQAISCQRHSLDESGKITVTSIAVDNLAIPAHVDVWKKRIQDYGNDPAKSSLLYEGTGFVMRMHLHDHEPPHLHIYPRRGDTGDRIARVCIDNCDLLDGSLSSAMDHEITDVITRNRKTLLDGWHAIKTGKLPLKLAI